MNLTRPLLILCLLLSLSLLFAQEADKTKISLNLGVVSGATIGVELGSPSGKNQESYLNICAHYAHIISFAGVNYETRHYNSKNKFYYLTAAGIDYLEMMEIFSEDFHHYFLPHLVAGIGYRFKVGQDSHMFIEWDFGLKPSITNINLGISF